MAKNATPPADRTPRKLDNLAWYAAAAATAGVAPAAGAQVIYTDPEPDSLVTDTFVAQAFEGISFDFDGDSDPELIIGERIDAAYILGVTDSTAAGLDRLDGVIGALVPFGGENYRYPAPLDAGIEVGEGATFVANDDCVPCSNFTFTFGGSDPLYWLTAGEKYIGLRFQVDNGGTETTHYGWMRVEVPPEGGAITVKDYAINATPDAPIVTGQGVANEPGTGELPDVYALSEAQPNPFSAESRLTLRLAEAQAVRAEVYNALGQRVAVLHDGVLGAGNEHTLALDGRDLPAGLYVVRIEGERFSTTRRIVLAR